MGSNRAAGEAMRAQANDMVAASARMFELADELDPPDDDELVDREIRADNDAMWTLFIRVYDVVTKKPGISTAKIASCMGLPGNYPTANSHHFTGQILDWLMAQGLVYPLSSKKPYEWMANPVPKKNQNQSLRLVKG